MKDKEHLKAMVRGAYDLQKVRIQMGNRIAAEFRAEHGLKAGEKLDTIDKEGAKIMEAILLSFKRLTDGLVRMPAIDSFQGDKIISSYAMLSLVGTYKATLAREEAHFRDVGKVLEGWPIWTEFLSGVRGIGPVLGGVIITEIDIHKARYPSSLFRYAGLDVHEGEGRGRRAHHLIDVEYTDKNGESAVRKGVTFNPFLKTKLVGVLATSFVKQPAAKSPYRKIYDDYKHRLENHPEHSKKSLGHRNNMALRYVAKQFLIDLYMVWRPMEGLDCRGTYAEAKLGIKHRAA